MEMLDPIVRFFQSGGVFMYPILLIFAIIILHCLDITFHEKQSTVVIVISN